MGWSEALYDQPKWRMGLYEVSDVKMTTNKKIIKRIAVPKGTVFPRTEKIEAITTSQ